MCHTTSEVLSWLINVKSTFGIHPKSDMFSTCLVFFHGPPVNCNISGVLYDMAMCCGTSVSPSWHASILSIPVVFHSLLMWRGILGILPWLTNMTWHTRGSLMTHLKSSHDSPCVSTCLEFSHGFSVCQVHLGSFHGKQVLHTGTLVEKQSSNK